MRYFKLISVFQAILSFQIGVRPAFAQNAVLNFNVCSIMPALGTITTFIVSISIPLSVVAITWGGFLIMTTAADPKNLDRGKKAILYGSIGLAVVFGGYTILKGVFSAIGVNLTA